MRLLSGAGDTAVRYSCGVGCAPASDALFQRHPLRGHVRAGRVHVSRLHDGHQGQSTGMAGFFFFLILRGPEALSKFK